MGWGRDAKSKARAAKKITRINVCDKNMLADISGYKFIWEAECPGLVHTKLSRGVGNEYLVRGILQEMAPIFLFLTASPAMKMIEL